MVPSRLAVFTALFAGLLLAVALDGLWSGGGWALRGLAVLTALVVLAVLAPPGPFRARPVVATPPFFTGGAVRALPRDGVALVVPFPRRGRTNVAMVWQAQAGMWFKMPGGYFVGPDPGGGTRHDAPPTTTSVVLNRIQRGRRPPELTPALRRKISQDFASWRVASVVLGPMNNREAMRGFLSDLLGRPPASAGGVAVWPDAAVAPAVAR
jgi:dolichyl-phosphate beta-glucosyltransferase